MSILTSWDHRVLLSIEATIVSVGRGPTMEELTEICSPNVDKGRISTAVGRLRDASFASEHLDEGDTRLETTTAGREWLAKPSPEHQEIKQIRDGLMRELDRLTHLLADTRRVWTTAEFSDAEQHHPVNFLNALREQYLYCFENAATGYEAHCREPAEDKNESVRLLEETWQWLECCSAVDLLDLSKPDDDTR